ncbi:phage holin family protein [Rubrivirga sp. S365]|uniref:Phage holin family protein n=1 Tax=Rubrivirga litoralis TaxID=3075598 RepID=A0ABU3BSP5_9BACT|nr:MULTISPECIES: phage holin family protein [unclassified Rubrivirga]MDT0632255.1 phage holin family protein [Rubrivirga sp. F394]MDT7856381.1 phage holin family protein [Rubrivirga sp. S365]
MSLLLRWVASAAALLLVATLVPGVQLDGIGAALVAAVVLGLINATIKPVLKLLSLPIRLLTLGLFTLVINAALFALAAWLVPGFGADGFGSVFIGAIVYGLLTWAIAGLLGGDD